MKFLVNLLLMPVLFNTFTINRTISNSEEKELEKQITERCSPEQDDSKNKITVDLLSEPYEGDYFFTTFHYNGNVPLADYWMNEDNVLCDWDASNLYSNHYVNVEVLAPETQANFTLYLMDGNDDVYSLTVYTHWTEYGIFASTGSQQVCDNMVLEYEYNNGFIDDEDLINAVNTSVQEEIGLFPKPWLRPIHKFDIAAPTGKTGFEGKITWKDREGGSHPCSGLYYEFYDDTFDQNGNAIPETTGYLDEDGDFSFLRPTSTLSNRNPRLKLYARTRVFSVNAFFIGIATYTVTINLGMAKGYYHSTNHVFKNDDKSGRPMVIASSLYWAQEWVALVNGSYPGHCDVKYPHFDTCEFAGGVYLEEPYFEVMDVILHEYGHAMEDQLGLFDAWHMLDYTAEHNFWTDYTVSRSKGAAMREGFTESLATVFALMIQKTYSDYFSTIPQAGDTYYDDYTWFDATERLDLNHHEANTDFENLSSDYVGRADATELTIGAAIYDLYDIDFSEEHDKIYLGNGGLWDILKTYKPKTFSDLVKALYNNGIVNKDYLGNLLDYFGFTARDIGQSFHVDNRPIIVWNYSGDTAHPNSKTIGNNYSLVFYSASDKKLFEVNGIVSNAYHLNETEWYKITSEPGAYYKVAIGAKSTTGDYTTGPYFGAKVILNKTNTIYETVNIDQFTYSNFSQNYEGNRNFASDEFLNVVYWKNVTEVTNVRNEKFFCLSAGMSTDHLSYLQFETSKTFSSVSMDFVFYTNRSNKSTACLKLYTTTNGSYWSYRATVNLDVIPMDKDWNVYNYQLPCGGNVKGLKLEFTGYGYTALCVRNFMFDTRVL